MYVCLEGIDGSGKSTQLKMLGQWLEEYGFQVRSVFEPTDSPAGLLIRNMLKEPNASTRDLQRTLGLLFAADRMMLMEKIQEAESHNEIVISDRSFYSSLAYQDEEEWILEINKHIKKPDLVILLDVEIEIALSRCEGKDHFENREFLEKVRKNYLNLAEKNNFLVVNANNGARKVHEDVKIILSPKIGRCV
ncbi:MAG TPA: dTMP kinase [Methanobacteriaceae archaeon]|nr:dTMP kinase [Methanobacteriaceae archaeon]